MNGRLHCTIVLALLAVSGCKGREAAAPTAKESGPAVSAATFVVGKEALPRVYEAVGTVRSKTTSILESKVMGQVKAVHVVEGDRVTAGQLLVELDDRELASALVASESAVAEAESALKEIDLGINAAGAAQSAAQAARELADATNERFKNLSDSNAVSRQAFDETNAKQRASAADVRRADESRKSLVAKKGEVEARVQQARAQLEANKAQLSHTRVLAPFDGIIIGKRVQPGTLAAPGVPLLEIEDAQLYRLEVSVDESVYAAASGGALRPGEPVPVAIDALQNQLINGTIDEIVPSADPRSRSFLVKASLPKNEALRSGMFGRARFTYREDHVLAVPATAVMERGQLTGVFAVGADRVAQWRLVTLGKRLGEKIEVLSGVSEGEHVVLDPSGKVQDGQAVAAQ